MYPNLTDKPHRRANREAAQNIDVDALAKTFFERVDTARRDTRFLTTMPLRIRTLVAFVLAAACACTIAFGSQFIPRHSVTGVTLVAGFAGLFPLVLFLAWAWQDLLFPRRYDTPARALKAFIKAVAQRRKHVLHGLLATTAYDTTAAFPQLPGLDMPQARPVSLATPDGVSAYWRSVAGFSNFGLCRISELGRPVVVVEDGDIAFAEVQFTVEVYPAWALLTVLIGLPIGAVMMILVTKKQRLAVAKAMVRNELGQWRLLSGEVNSMDDEFVAAGHYHQTKPGAQRETY